MTYSAKVASRTPNFMPSISLLFSSEADRQKVGIHEVERRVATLALTDGAAVFFPDKEARRKQLFSMMSSSGSSSTESNQTKREFYTSCRV